MTYIPIKIANRELPGYASCPNIHRTGSIRGMVKQFGWKPGHAVRIGGYIYHLDGQIYYDAKHLLRGRKK